MDKSCRIPHVGILIYPYAQMAAVHGLTDLFAVADRLGRARLAMDGALLRVTHWGPGDEHGGVALLFDNVAGAAGDPDIIILPPSLGDPPDSPSAAPFTGWLRACHARGAALGSVCAGTFLLAETGLLAGRAATTHWTYGQTLADRFPDIRVDTDKLLIDDGDLITAGGMMAWTDLGLKLVDRLLGPVAMMETARFLLVDPPGREQRYYSAFSPRLAHGDAAVLKVQHWLQANGTRGATLGAMAAQAGLEKRTFLRRFCAATGLRPIEYCQHVRVGKARELLEATNKPLDQIACEIGYGDPASFRKLFLKISGLTPGSYRRRFAPSRVDALPV